VVHYRELMRAKLGLKEWMPEDGELITGLLEILQKNQVDYTAVFRGLGAMSTAGDAPESPLRDLFLDRQAFDAWANQYRRRLRTEGSTDADRSERMNSVNPKFILRNYLAQNAIALATEKRDFSEIDRLLTLLRRPYEEQPGMERYLASPPDGSKHLVVCCSS
jgi:uncharacterized protein YdiU (UPF0061 family)